MGKTQDIFPDSGEWVEIPIGMSYLSCCDCGLAHLIKLKLKNGKVLIAAERANTLSKKNRKEEKYAYTKYI